jgi:hypothetical protein
MVRDEAHLRRGHRNHQLHRGHQCSETKLTGDSRFHIITPWGFEPGSLVTGSKQVVHWTSETWWEWSEIAGSPQIKFSKESSTDIFPHRISRAVRSHMRKHKEIPTPHIRGLESIILVKKKKSTLRLNSLHGGLSDRGGKGGSGIIETWKSQLWLCSIVFFCLVELERDCICLAISWSCPLNCNYHTARIS